MIDWKKLDPTIIEYIEVQIIDWPTLFLYDRYEMSCLAVLKQLFGTVGNGVEWKNGEPVITRRCDGPYPEEQNKLDAREIAMLTGRISRQKGVPGSDITGRDFLPDPIPTADGFYELYHYKKIRVEWLDALKWTLSAYLELVETRELYWPNKLYFNKGFWTERELKYCLENFKKSDDTRDCLKSKLAQANAMKPYIRRTRKAKVDDLKNTEA